MFFVEFCLGFRVIFEFCDFAVDVFTDLVELLVKVWSIALFQHTVDTIGKRHHPATAFSLLAE